MPPDQLKEPLRYSNQPINDIAYVKEWARIADRSSCAVELYAHTRKNWTT
jgi:hypothetical protein